MPDRWGRVTGEDFFDIAKGLHGLSQAQEAKQNQNEINLGLGTLEKTGEMPDDLGIKPQNRAAAQEAFARSRVARQQGEDAELSHQQTQLENQYLDMAAKAQTPEERLSVLNGINPDSLAGMRALASVQKQVMSSQDNQVAMLGGLLKKGETEYTNVARPAIVAAQDQLTKGDPEQAANTLAALSRLLPLRGEYRVENDGQGNVSLRRFHNEREAGLSPQTQPATQDPTASDSSPSGLGLGAPTTGASAGGAGLGLGDAPQGAPQQQAGKASADHYAATDEVLSVQDALNYLKGMTGQQYAMQMANHRAANMDFNADAIAKGGVMGKDGDGKRVRVIPLINPNDSTRQFAVFDSKGQSVVPDSANPDRKAWTADEFFNSGIQIVNKEQRALDNDERRVATDEKRTAIEGARLGLEGKRLSLSEREYNDRKRGGGGGSAAVDFVRLKNEKLRAYQRNNSDDSTPDELEQKATAAALADFRLLPGFENVQSPADIAARSKAPRGVKPGVASQPQAAPAAPAVNPAQQLWNNKFKGK